MLHLNYDTFKLTKIFAELRFKDSFKLPQNEIKYKILDKLSNKYQIYNNDNPEILSFFNPEKMQQVHIQLNRIFINWEKPEGFDDFIKSSQADCAFILKSLEVETVQRAGIRTINTFDGPNQSAINEFIFNHYLTTKFKSNSFADDYFNPRIQLSGKKGKLFFNLGIGYQQEQIIEGKMNEILNQKTSDLLLVDLDSYRENIKVNKLSEFFTDAKNLNSSLPDYIKSIKE